MRHIRQLCLYLLLVFGSPAVLFAQLTPPDIRKAVIEQWQMKDGLPHQRITALAQTTDGFLWIGTPQGLARYSGLHFTIFDRTNVKEMLSADITSLAAASDGSLFIGTANGLLHYYDGRFVLYADQSGLPATAINALAAGIKGTVWIGTNAGLMQFYDSNVRLFSGNGTFDKKQIIALQALADGSVYVLTAEKKLYYIEADKVTEVGGLHMSNAAAVRLAADNNALYLAENISTIYKCEKDRCVTKSLSKPAAGQAAALSAILSPVSQELLCVFENGTYLQLSEKNGERQLNLPGFITKTLFKSSDGQIWAGTDNGLIVLRKPLVTLYGIPEGLSSDMTYAVFEDSRGVLWIGTRGAGLSLLENGKIKNIDTKKLPSLLIGGLAEDPMGNLLVGTAKGTVLLQNGRVFPFERKLIGFNRAVAAFLVDEDGLWVGAQGALLYKPQKGTEVSYEASDKTNRDAMIWHIFKDSKKRIWAATSEGLWVIENGKRTIYTKKDRLLSNIVLSVYEDRDGAIWVATQGGGISLLVDGKIISVSVSEGFQTDTVYAILEDTSDRLWMSSPKGIVVFDRTNLRNNILKNERISALYNIDHRDGMRSVECTGGVQPAAVKTKKGTLIFPTVKGLVEVDPKVVEQAFTKPRAIVVEQADRAAEPVTGNIIPTKTIDNKLSILVNAPNLYKAEEDLVEFSLNSETPVWNSMNTQRNLAIDTSGQKQQKILLRTKSAAGVMLERSYTIMPKPEKNGNQRKTPIAPILLGIIAFLGTLAASRLLLFKKRKKDMNSMQHKENTYEKSDCAVRDDIAQEQSEQIDFEITEPELNENTQENKQKYEKNRLDDQTAELLLNQLLSYMEQEKAWKNPDISLPQLSEKTGITVHNLSQIINDRLNRNFFTFINTYRVDEAKRLLQLTDNNDKILSIAYDAGFRSKTTFNTIFKKFTGLTPTEYRKNIQSTQDTQIQ